ncbi:MAG TPA: hypothetical protein VHT96_10665 [Clostridia bacterium]|nr:hypothetical protein [Clostridia bacterium]
MDFNSDFYAVRSQKLLLIPQLKQAIEILEMNSGELLSYIQTQMETNPLLENAADSGIPRDTSDADITAGNDEDQDAAFNEVPVRELTLKEHLLLRLDAVCSDKMSFRIGEFLIDNTDDNGYLKIDTREVAYCLDVPEELAKDVLGKLQEIGPPGICARDLRECLLIQLRQLDDTDEEAMLIVEEYLDAIARDDIETVSDLTGIPAERVKNIFNKVRELEPKPGREFYSSKAEKTELPDLFIHDTSDGPQVLLSEEAFPDICISESFKPKPTRDEAPGGYFRDRLNSAVWLLKCLEQRKDIIYAIAQKICELEKEFFDKGPKAFRLLDKSAFSASLSMHESILDKALSGKYLQSRWGTYELGSFFTRKQRM